MSAHHRKFSRSIINKATYSVLLLITFFAVQSIITAENICAASLHLAWNSNGEADLAGYRVYYESSSSSGMDDVKKVTDYELKELAEGVWYDIAISAYDTNNNESEKSDTVQALAQSISTTTTSATTIKPLHDDTPPTGSVIINNGLTVTDLLDVILTISGIDDGAELGEHALMSFSNDNQNWSDPEPYTTTKMWTLSPGEGEKKIYVTLCDAAGNWMIEPAQDHIIYEESENSCEEPQKLRPISTTASSQFLPFFSQDNAVDGNPLTTWLTLLSFFKKDEFITLDLGGIKRISWLTMQAASTLFGADLFPINFKLEISSDNITWEEISTEQGYTPPIQSNHADSWDFKSIECRYIRVYITKAKTIFFFFKIAQIAEIDVYGCDIAGAQSLITDEGLASVNLKDHDQAPPAIPGKPKNSSAGSSDDDRVAYENEVYQENSIVCDNGSHCTSFSGIWEESDQPDSYGGTALISRESGTHTWTPDLLKEGYYQLYMWWSAGIANCSSCPVEISCDGGLLDTLYIDQQQGGGQWNLLGPYDLEAGNACTVTMVSGDSSLETCADAVRFVYMEESLPEAKINLIYPDTAAVGEEVCLEGYGMPGDGISIEGYMWTSNLDGVLSTSNSFCTSSLSEGIHLISFTVEDDEALYSVAAEAMLSVGIESE